MRLLTVNIKNRFKSVGKILKLGNKKLRAVFFSSIFLSLTILNYISDWWVFKVSGSSEVKIRESSDFSDLMAIKSFVACYREVGNSIYLYDENFSCHMGYFYGSTLIKLFAIMKLDSIPLVYIGSGLTILFCLSLGVFTSKIATKRGQFIFVVISSLFSPGIWLLLERTNLDILIFLMVFTGSQLFSRGNEIFGTLVIALSALFKFYTLPVLLFLLVITNKKLTKIVGFLLVSLVFSKVFFDLTSITNPGFPSTWYISFGIKSFGLYLNLFLEHFNQNRLTLNSFGIGFLGYFLLIVALILLSKFNKGIIERVINVLKVPPDCPNLNFMKNIFWIFGSSFISCYLVGMSYDYRLSFLAVAGISFIELARYQEIRIKGLTLLLIFALWGSGSFLPSTSLVLSGLIQLIGDVAIFILSIFFILVLLNEIKSKISQKSNS
jgi:hypothetical protein